MLYKENADATEQTSWKDVVEWIKTNTNAHRELNQLMGKILSGRNQI